MKGWKEEVFSDVVDISPYTKLPNDTPISFVEMKDLSESNKFVEPKQERLLTGGARFKNGDTLFARITPCLENGKICQVRNLKNGVGFGSTEFLVFRAKDKITDSNFIYYLAKSSELRNFAESNFDGSSGRQRVPKDCFNKFKFLLPSLSEQQAIAEVLSSLDDKIELLHRQNETLEEMAEVIFYETVILRIIQDNIPADWIKTSLGNEINTFLGGTPSTTNNRFWENGTIPWINSGEVNKFRILKPTSYITELALNKSNTKLLPKGTTVVAITGATLGQVSLLEIDTCANQSVVGLVPNSKISSSYIYLYIKLRIQEIITNQTGGAQQHINKNDINNFELILPKQEELIVLENKISELFKKISNNSFEIIKITTLKNTLLPKLLSNQIQLKNLDHINNLSETSL